MSDRILRIVTQSFPERASFDTAASRAILLRVAREELPPTLRLYRPDPIVAFGRQDVMSPGFHDAVRRAGEQGFVSVIRLVGGRAAVFHEGTIAFAWATPDRDPHARTLKRFVSGSELFAAALRQIGIDALVGEVPGEYCPGRYSINARAQTKLVGIGQRIISGAAHVGGVVVANEAGRVRDVLIPVYRSLDLEWDPQTVGSIEDEVGATYEEAFRAIVSEFEARFDLEDSVVDSETMRLAKSLEQDHAVPVQRVFR